MPPFSQNFITFQKIKNINHYSSKRHVQARAKHIVFGHFSAVFLLIFLPFLCRVRRKHSRDLTYCGCREKDICEWRFKNMFSNVLFEKLLWTFMPDLLRKLDECGTFQMSIIRRKMHHYYFCRRRRLPYCTAGCTVPKVHWIGRGAC